MGSGGVIEAIFGIIFWGLVVYLLYICCFKRKRDRGAVFTSEYRRKDSAFGPGTKIYFCFHLSAVQAVPAETTRTTIGPGGNITTMTVMPATAYIASQAPYPVQQGPYGPPHVQVAPYPVHAPYQAAPYPGATPYAAPAYPTHGAGMPQPYQGAGGAAPPYPVAPNPPPYDQVVSHEGYQKQAPFNPNYGGN